MYEFVSHIFAAALGAAIAWMIRINWCSGIWTKNKAKSDALGEFYNEILRYHAEEDRKEKPLSGFDYALFMKLGLIKDGTDDEATDDKKIQEN